MSFLSALLALGLTPLVFDLRCVDPVLAPKLACWLAGAGLAALTLRLRPLGPAAIACLLWLGWSLITAGMHGKPWHHVTLLQVSLGGLWLLGSAVPTRAAERLLLASWTLTLIYSWVQRLQLDPFPWSHPGLSQVRTIAGLGNPNFLAMYLACLLPLVWSRSRGLALLGWVTLVLTATRGAQLAVVIVGVGWLLAQRRGLRQLALATALVVLSWWGCQQWLLSNTPSESLAPSARKESVSIRLILWQSALQQSIEHPILGVGPGNFGFEYLRNRPLEPEDLRALQRCPEDPHSQPLFLLAEQGWPGLLLWLAWMGACLRGLWPQQKTSALCLGVLLLNGLTNAYPLSIWPLLFHWTTLTLPAETGPGSPRLRWWGLPVALALIWAGVCGWLFQRAIWWEDEYRIWCSRARNSQEYQQWLLRRRANLDRAARWCPPWFTVQQASYEFQFYLELLHPAAPSQVVHKSEQWALRRIDLQPANPYAWMSLAQVRERQGRWTEAVAVWQQTQQLDPRNPAVLFWLARAEFQAGQVDASQRHLRQSIEINSKNYQVYQLEAQIMIDRGRTWEGYWSWVQGSSYR